MRNRFHAFSPAALLLAGGLALVAGPLSAAEHPAEGNAPPVKSHLDRTKAYPEQEVSVLTSDERPEGRAIVSFHVKADGQFENVAMVQSSGVAMLDEQTMKSVKQANCMECAGHDYTVAYTYKN